MHNHKPRRSIMFWRSSPHRHCSCGWFGYSWTGHIRSIERSVSA